SWRNDQRPTRRASDKVGRRPACCVESTSDACRSGSHGSSNAQYVNLMLAGRAYAGRFFLTQYKVSTCNLATIPMFIELARDYNDLVAFPNEDRPVALPSAL